MNQSLLARPYGHEGLQGAGRDRGTVIDRGGHGIVTIGASAGGGEALVELIGRFPADLPAAVFVVYHMPAGAEGLLADTLNPAGPLPAKRAKDGEEFRQGIVYVASPDRHLLVKSGHLRVTRGPRENRWRPAIDPLFRSAAVAYGSGVIGVVLSGMLDDGTAGLLAIKRCGGVAMVQDPQDAAYPDMPQSALANVDIDHRLPIPELADMIVRLVREPAVASPAPPREIALEARVAEKGAERAAPGRVASTGFSCPECGGPLHEESTGDFQQYRCLVGHAWSPQTLLAGSNDALEATVWAAIRLFRQRAHLQKLAAGREREAGRSHTARRYEYTADEALEHAHRLQQLMVTSLDSPESGAELPHRPGSREEESSGLPERA